MDGLCILFILIEIYIDLTFHFSLQCSSAQDIAKVANCYYSSAITITPLHSKGKFSCQVNQCVRYDHRYLELVILIKTSTNNPNRKSVVLESFAKPSLGCGIDFDKHYKLDLPQSVSEHHANLVLRAAAAQ